jgi:hypothetical protein
MLGRVLLGEPGKSELHARLKSMQKIVRHPASPSSVGVVAPVVTTPADIKLGFTVGHLFLLSSVPPRTSASLARGGARQYFFVVFPIFPAPRAHHQVVVLGTQAAIRVKVAVNVGAAVTADAHAHAMSS